MGVGRGLLGRGNDMDKGPQAGRSLEHKGSTAGKERVSEVGSLRAGV